MVDEYAYLLAADYAASLVAARAELQARSCNRDSWLLNALFQTTRSLWQTEPWCSGHSSKPPPKLKILHITQTRGVECLLQVT